MKNNIILCGFMGCGKTTVGKILTTKLGYKLVDTDSYIEQKEQLSVSEIFLKKGETYFRRLEADVAKELGRAEGLIIATGGGMMLDAHNAQELNKSGVSFYITITPETVVKRLENDTSRPLLMRDDKETAVRELIDKRHPVYSAHCKHKTNGELSAVTVADNIISVLKTLDSINL